VIWWSTDGKGASAFPTFAAVPRAQQYQVTALDRTQAFELSCGIFPRVVQHETDHLDGVLFSIA
jgi:peptide deformylase